MKVSATGLNNYDSEKIASQFICPHPVAIYMYITIIFKHLRNRLANQSQIFQCVHENLGHIPRWPPCQYMVLFFCPVTALADSQVSDRYPWATCSNSMTFMHQFFVYLPFSMFSRARGNPLPCKTKLFFGWRSPLISDIY